MLDLLEDSHFSEKLWNDKCNTLKVKSDKTEKNNDKMYRFFPIKGSLITTCMYIAIVCLIDMEYQLINQYPCIKNSDVREINH